MTRWSLIPALFTLVLLCNSTATAQNFVAIDANRNLYCAELPNGTNQLVRYNSTNGAVSGVSPRAVFRALKKTYRAIQQRRDSLKRLQAGFISKKIVRDYQMVYRAIKGKKFKGNKDDAINALASLISELNQRLDGIRTTVQLIRDCENNVRPDTTGGTLSFIEFPFTHPDFGGTYYMYGIGITVSMPERSLGAVCVSASQNANSGTWLPNDGFEKYAVAQRNPCSGFYPTTFRNYPDCSGEMIDGNPLTAVLWLDVVFSTRPASESTRRQYDNTLEKINSVSVRPYRKQSPCNEKD